MHTTLDVKGNNNFAFGLESTVSFPTSCGSFQLLFSLVRVYMSHSTHYVTNTRTHTHTHTRGRLDFNLYRSALYNSTWFYAQRSVMAKEMLTREN